ncbi:MAG: chromosomal replication initiator DnaA, partial [Alphaproteobacteria bacterium]
MEAEDFFVSDCNRDAIRLIDAWPEWTSRVQVLVGPAGSGKTHLAHVWRLASGASL